MLTGIHRATSMKRLNFGLRRWMRRGPAVVVLLLRLCPVGCATAPVASSKEPARPLRTATLDEVLAAYDGYCKGIDTLSASGDLDIRDLRAGKAHRVGVRVVATRGGRLYLKGSVAVITALEVVSNGERFWFQVPSKKTVWTGDAAAAASSEAGTEKAPYYVLRPSDVTSALIPDPLDPGPEDSLVLESDRRAYSVTLAHLAGGRGIARRRVWLDRETLLPQRIRGYDEHGDITSDVTLGSWKDGTPRLVMVLRPGEGYEASFSLSKVQTNVTVPEKAFAPRTPEGYRIVEVGSK